MAFKRALVLIQVGVATLHRRQAHEHKAIKQYKLNELQEYKTTKQKHISLEQTLPSEKEVCARGYTQNLFFLYTRQIVL